MKIRMDAVFTLDLAHFLHNIGGAQVAQLNIGGAGALPNRYKVTPMVMDPAFGDQIGIESGVESPKSKSIISS